MLLLGNLLWTTTGGGFVPPIPPTPPPPAEQPRGQLPWLQPPATLRVPRRTKKQLEEERLRFGIPLSVQGVIAEVAASQVEILRLDEQQRTEQLQHELKLRGIEWESRYLEALNARREALIDAEIARLLRQKLDDEMIVLMLIAASLA
jgi:hypothetical protein